MARPETVSVVIPCHDHGGFLAEAIASVRAQRGVVVQLVVVDDGSSDATAAVIDGLAQRGDVLLRQPRAGVSAARNAGLAASDGAFVVFLDADDRLLPGAVARGVAALRRRPESAFAAGRHRRIDARGRPLADDERRAVVAGRMAAAGAGQDQVYRWLLHGNFVHTAAVVYRRAALEAVGGFDPRLQLCEDWQLYLRLARQRPALLHDDVVSEYRAHGAQTTARRAADLLVGGLALLRRQRPLLRSAEERAAWRAGVAFWRRYYGHELVARLRAELRVRSPAAALRTAAVLVRHAPGHAAASVGRGLGRAIGLRRRAGDAAS